MTMIDERMDERAYTPLVFEKLPPEVIAVCVNCTRKKCSGECKSVLETERKYVPGRDSPPSHIVARAYPFRGDMVTVRQMCEMTGGHEHTVRKMLKRGMNMEEIYERITEFHAKKRARQGGECTGDPRD